MRKAMASKRPKRTKVPQKKSVNRTNAVGPIAALPEQNRYFTLFLLNVIIAFVWQMIVPLFGLFDYAIGFGVGFVGITIFDRPYAVRAYRLLYFIGYVIWEIVLSNLSLAKLVLQPKPKLDPGIIAVPLTVSSGLEIMILASVITLTPGTISVDLGQQPDGRQVLYVHNLIVGDPEAFRRSVQQGFERRILQITRGVSA
jgi:multicomponent Na+:H+ antiporter subunit E